MNNNSEVLTFVDFAIRLLEDYPKYNSKYSNKIYTNQQKIILLLIKQRFNLSYKQIIELIKISESIFRKLALLRIPNRSTLKKFAKQISCVKLNEFLGKSLSLINCNKFELVLMQQDFNFKMEVSLSKKNRFAVEK